MATTFAVPDGRVAMAATTYTGNGSTQTVSNAINGVGFQPDFVWSKSRSAAQNHREQDSVRGLGVELYPNLTNAEGAGTPGTLGIVSFNATGYSVGDVGTNTNGNTYVGWQWKAGGTAVSNTAGTITSSVSANTTAGFSVVTYTGTGANATVGHGLGVVPSMIIIKARTGAVSNWHVYHVSVGNTAATFLNLTDAAFTSSAYWQNTSPTSTVFSIGTAVGVNAAVNLVAYCWVPVAGYSAFGSYTGNSLDDGPFVYTGFRPRWLLIKSSTTSATSWYLFDTARNPINVSATSLYPEAAYAEGVSSVSILDILSNGFKLRGISGGTNGAATYIYAAFAENPLKYANAR
jgi:hypothetical protein